MSQFYDQDQSNEENDTKELGLQKKSDKEKILYFEFELKQINDIFNQSQSNSSVKTLTFLSIKDITRLVKNQ